MAQDRSREDPAQALVRAQELLWGRREPRSRGPKPGLTLDQIVEAAIALADAEGMGALSMRRVARELGAGTMTLYRHVAGKDELLALMLDRVSDSSDLIARAEDMAWRTVLEHAARGSRELYLNHPWLIQVNWARPSLGPNSLAGVNFVIGGLDGIGVTGQERVMILTLLDAYVVGSARGQLQYSRAAEETGISDEEFWELQRPFLEQAMASGAFPALAALDDDAFNGDWDETFELGLRWLLDGLEQYVRGRAG